jgi:hypothetical protein
LSPARLAGPGHHRKVAAALDQADWQHSGRVWASPCGRGRLTVPDRPDDEWRFSEHAASGDAATWAARFTSGTPAEFVAAFATRFADALSEEGLWSPACGLPVLSWGGTAVLDRAGWTREHSLTGWTITSPDGTGRYESRLPWEAGQGGSGPARIPEHVVGAVVGQRCLWRAWFTPHVPGHLLDLALWLLANGQSEVRHESQLDPAVLPHLRRRPEPAPLGWPDLIAILGRPAADWL